jgi:hypothetical protein
VTPSCTSYIRAWCTDQCNCVARPNPSLLHRPSQSQSVNWWTTWEQNDLGSSKKKLTHDFHGEDRRAFRAPDQNEGEKPSARICNDLEEEKVKLKEKDLHADGTQIKEDTWWGTHKQIIHNYCPYMIFGIVVPELCIHRRLTKDIGAGGACLSRLPVSLMYACMRRIWCVWKGNSCPFRHHVVEFLWCVTGRCKIDETFFL